MRVGFVGAGRMGRPMVDRLVAAGHEVTVLGRTPRARQALLAAGARPVGQARAVAEKSDVVCVCVFSDEQVRSIALGGTALGGTARDGTALGGTARDGTALGGTALGGTARDGIALGGTARDGIALGGTARDGGLVGAVPEGGVLVIHTTGSPGTARAIASAGAARGVAVIDAPVSGGPHDIAAGRITLLVGGDGRDVDRARPVLSAYGDPILHVGPLGAGQAVKLVNNAVFAANLGLLAQAVRLGEELGVPEEGLLAALPHGSAASRALSVAAGRGSVATSAAMLAEFLAKDVAVVRAVAAELGAGLGVLDAAIAELEILTGD